MIKNLENKTIKPQYKKITDKIKLNDIKTLNFFKTHNGTRCWHEGIDESTIKTDNNINKYSDNKCTCKQGWHGNDCGQPEVVWRGIMSSKKNLKLKQRNKLRRIIYNFNIKNYNTDIIESIIDELYHVVDLFVICDYSDDNDDDNNYRHKLDKGLLINKQSKILYINLNKRIINKPSRLIMKYIWSKIFSVVKNLNDDDIYITSEPEEILNWRALMFLKIYDGWPEPIAFRLRYSVFGFFWIHPNKTKINIGACTISMVNNHLNNNQILIQNEFNERDKYDLIIGDLNHYGGWYCQYCQSPANILLSLKKKNDNYLKNNQKYNRNNIDVLFIEDLIGTGLLFDGKTMLKRAYKSRDSYYAPESLLNNNYKYDWLVENFYAKLDYY